METNMNFHFQDEQPFAEKHAELIAWLGAQSWSDFAQSLWRQATRKGSLSERQLGAAYGMKDKAELRAKAQQEQPPAPQVECSPLFAAFARAKQAGLKWPAVVLGPLRITMASETSKNPGHLYVKLDGAYAGKVTPDGRLLARGLGPAELLRITDLLADPGSAARTYGQETGQCCCCGRELTNPDSIAAGIGPICAERWGL